MGCFMNVIKNMISEDKEYKRITSEKLIQDIKKRNGSISQENKEFIDRYGVKGYINLPKLAKSALPRQYYIYNISTSIRYGYRSMDQDYSDALSALTFKEALERVYGLINKYINDYPQRKFYIEVSEKYKECEKDIFNPYEIVVVEKSKNIIITTTYTINRSLVTILPDNAVFIVPFLKGDKVYEL